MPSEIRLSDCRLQLDASTSHDARMDDDAEIALKKLTETQ
jgi:hypothetical protein